MRFAILGSHPDGLEMASALVESGRHELIAYTDPFTPASYVTRWGTAVRCVGDLEEVLADPAIEAVIVAGAPANRPQQLRRALQSERHVLCVYPPAGALDLPYEAAMIQKDTGCVLLPLLTEALHPGIQRLAELARRKVFLGEFRLVEMERWSAAEVLLGDLDEGNKLSLPGWDVFRSLGGALIEVSALAPNEELTAGVPVLLAGRFEHGGLLQAAFVPGQREPRWRLAVVGSQGRAELAFPQGWPGPAYLCWRDEKGEGQEEAWGIWDPWPVLVQAFESAAAAKPPSGDGEQGPAWQDAVRCLELDDAVRRSIHYRRASTLEYPDASEEVGFKGTMTLVGCGLLWVIILVAILSRWVPELGWLVAPVLVLFLALQLLRWIIPRSPAQAVQRERGRSEDR